MSTYAIYRVSDGQIVSHVTCHPRQLERNTPKGFASKEGSYDALSQRIDVETGLIVDYQPPQPDADHEWDAQAKRWNKRAEVVDRETKRLARRARADELRRSQHDRVRVLLLELTKDPQLKAIDDEIANLLNPT